ncbi:Rieske (2Fe-2S) protein [Candidatus Sumerlaeota bacterium]|nr:Rieske (2Fe-2S) protein [Candidatus Sumerlaeota bacterium]HMZ51148.1 Rieske (2Fe-2S) protein [Candidatus Sumerlaeota bacterium]HNM45797.1 Rieske (2Fe-2S) protein [Candidatus Sumerlaeota bacterium]
MSQAEYPTPKWREDFPIEQEYDDFITRRDFVRFLGLVSAGLMVGSASVVVSSLTHEEGPFPEVEVTGAGDLKPGAWMVFRYPNEKTPAILIRRENGEYISFLQKCPHLACPVTYHRSDGEEGEHIGCHCHNGKFEIETGQGIQGPPRELRPLRQVVLKRDGDRVIATGLNEIRFA